MHKKTEYRNRITAISAASALMLMLFFVSGAPQASAATTNVTFDASYFGTVSGSFGARMLYNDATVTPGGEVEITFTAEQGTTALTLNLGSYGGSYTLNTDTPLGTTHIPLTSVVVADVGVDITGRMDGDINVTGPGSVNMYSLSWSTWGEKTVIVDASNAEAGDTIFLNLQLAYVVSLGASAVIDYIFGSYTVDIFDVDLGSLPASQNIQVQIDVESAGLNMMLIIVILLIIVIVAVVAVLAMKKKKAPPVQQQPQYNQQYPPQPGQQYPPQDQYGQQQQPQYQQYPPPPPGQ